jgi:hypothetical protein
MTSNPEFVYDLHLLNHYVLLPEKTHLGMTVTNERCSMKTEKRSSGMNAGLHEVGETLMKQTEKVSKSRTMHYSLARRTESLLDGAGRWRVPHELDAASVRATTIKEHVTCKECLKVLNKQ